MHVQGADLNVQTERSLETHWNVFDPNVPGENVVSYSPEDIDRLIETQQEGEHLEFKEDLGQFKIEELYRYCVAMANEGGGTFVLGIKDKPRRAVTGTGAFPELSKMKTQVFDKLKFRVDAEEVAHPNGRVLVFSIPPRPKGTVRLLEGAGLMRVGESIVTMTEDKLRAIFSEDKQDFLLCPARTDISEGDLYRLLDIDSYFDLMQSQRPTTHDAALHRFEQDQLVMRGNAGWNVTNLGALLFAKDLDEFGLRLKAPRVVVYQGTNKLQIVRDQIGGKGYAVGFQGLIEYINSQLPANEVIGQALRIPTRMYPEAAVRELVANALIHQDIEDSSSYVMVEIYRDRVEITNPGKPLIHTDHFIDGNKSRNEYLADVMRRLRISERLSSGIDRVIGLVEVHQLPAPDFRASEHQTTAVLYAHKPFEEMDRDERVRACYQHACLLWVNGRKMTNPTLRERFKLPESKTEVISRIIANSLEAKRIKADDPKNRSRRHARYIPHWA